MVLNMLYDKEFLKELDKTKYKSKLSSYHTKDYPAKEDPFTSFLSISKDQVKTWMFAEELGDYQKYLMELQKVMKSTGVQARIPYRVEI